MIHIFKEVRILKQEGKLHAKLLSRVRMLFIISTILLCFALFNVIFRHADPLIAAALAVTGFFLGLYVFARMNVVSWNEEKEVVQADKMDKFGYATLLLYIVFEISFRKFLKFEFPLTATAMLLSGIFGTIFGRAVGTVLTIHKVFAGTRVN